MSTPPVLIRSKTRIPAIAHGAIGRERVVATLTEAALGRQILNVVAPAGSGKTTAVVQFVAARPGPSAWLTLGDADGSPGRFVTYLAAAVAALSPETGARTHELLAGGISPADCAAILAEGLPGDSTLVIDDLHHIDDRPQVLNALRAFVEAIPPGALAVLVSRRLTRLNLSRSMLTGRADAVSAAELAFTVDEIADLLATRGVVAEPGEVAASSGGWAAGIVFEAIRGPRTGPGGPPPDDPFFAYMGSEVLDALPGNLRRQVVRSSLLETVDAEGLAALLDIESGEVLYGEIVRHQLPATQEPEGLRYHPRSGSSCCRSYGGSSRRRCAACWRGTRGACGPTATWRMPPTTSSRPVATRRRRRPSRPPRPACCCCGRLEQGAGLVLVAG